MAKWPKPFRPECMFAEERRASPAPGLRQSAIGDTGAAKKRKTARAPRKVTAQKRK